MVRSESIIFRRRKKHITWIYTKYENILNWYVVPEDGVLNVKLCITILYIQFASYNILPINTRKWMP